MSLAVTVVAWAAGVAVVLFLAYTLVHLDDLRHTAAEPSGGVQAGDVRRSPQDHAARPG